MRSSKGHSPLEATEGIIVTEGKATLQGALTHGKKVAERGYTPSRLQREGSGHRKKVNERGVLTAGRLQEGDVRQRKESDRVMGTLFFFFLNSITVHLRVQNTMWHFHLCMYM